MPTAERTAVFLQSGVSSPAAGYMACGVPFLWPVRGAAPACSSVPMPRWMLCPPPLGTQISGGFSSGFEGWLLRQPPAVLICCRCAAYTDKLLLWNPSALLFTLSPPIPVRLNHHSLWEYLLTLCVTALCTPRHTTATQRSKTYCCLVGATSAACLIRCPEPA